MLLAILGGAFVAVWGYFYITRDLPRLDRVEDYRPPAVSQVYDRNGELIGEFFDPDNRRYPVSIEKVPEHVRNAFVAAEDATFYSHPGIDVVSILRAAVKNIQSGSARQGGSTITQQVVKNLLLSSQKKLTRKLKEAILSYRLEQRLTKEEILQIYLNQIFFGNRSYGIQAAAQAYFHKSVEDLSIAEGAILAGLPKAPSRYSPLSNRTEAIRRQHYVLGQMVEAGFITASEEKAAKAEELQFYRVRLNTIFGAPYFVTEVRRQFRELFPHLTPDTGGYRIETTVDTEVTDMAQLSLNRGIEVVDRRKGWRGPIDSIEEEAVTSFLTTYAAPPLEVWSSESKHPALVLEVTPARAKILLPDGSEGHVSFKASSWARRLYVNDEETEKIELAEHIKVGDVLTVSLVKKESDSAQKNIFMINQIPEIQGALVLLDPSSGEIRTLIGGYDFQKNQYNRVTQSYRQPGSAFKPVVYLAAIDQFGYSGSTIVDDEPRTFKVGDQYWNPGNFDDSFLGPITLRTALAKSRNLVSADIISRIGVEWAIYYAKKLGIDSPLGTNLSLSLGSSEVTLLEMSRAYGVFANRGVLMPTVLISRIIDRDGTTLYSATERQLDGAKRVISEESAFLMANLMKGVVERGSGWRIRELGRPSAGKTGTSNDLMDAWYIGYTPNWVCGIWVGFDLKRTLGEKQTGGTVSSPIWLSFMKEFLQREEKNQYQQLQSARRREAEELGIEYIPPEPIQAEDFSPPPGVIGKWVDQKTGQIVPIKTQGAIFDYFQRGNEPELLANFDETSSYLEAPEF